MKDLLFSRISVVWLLLVAATLVSWEIGHGMGIDSVSITGSAILLVTFIKVWLVILDFMELRGAPRWMRTTGEAWVVLVCALLIGLFVHGSA